MLETSAEQLPTSRWPQASLTVGLAICEALEELLAGPEFLIKWPNDVYVGERKISGVLVETPSQQTNKLVLGIGINVNNSLGTAPAEISNSAIALCDMTDRQFTLTDVLVAVLNNLVERLGWIGTQDNELRKRWQNRCLLTNRRVEVDSDAGLVAGICQGTDEEGALLVRTDRGVRRCLAGSITLLN